MMLGICTSICTAILVFAAIFHFYWGFGGRYGTAAAIPQTSEGKPLFLPAAWGAHIIGLALLLALGCIYIASKWIALPFNLPYHAETRMMEFLSAIFLIRGLGWFKYAGLFKKVRHTYFARYDTYFYCPLFIVLGLCLLYIAHPA